MSECLPQLLETAGSFWRRNIDERECITVSNIDREYVIVYHERLGGSRDCSFFCCALLPMLNGSGHKMSAVIGEAY